MLSSPENTHNYTHKMQQTTDPYRADVQLALVLTLSLIALLSNFLTIFIWHREKRSPQNLVYLFQYLLVLDVAYIVSAILSAAVTWGRSSSDVSSVDWPMMYGGRYFFALSSYTLLLIVLTLFFSLRKFSTIPHSSSSFSSSSSSFLNVSSSWIFVSAILLVLSVVLISLELIWRSQGIMVGKLGLVLQMGFLVLGLVFPTTSALVLTLALVVLTGRRTSRRRNSQDNVNPASALAGQGYPPESALAKPENTLCDNSALLGQESPRDSALASQGYPQDSALASQGHPQDSALASQGHPQDSHLASQGHPQNSALASQGHPYPQNSALSSQGPPQNSHLASQGHTQNSALASQGHLQDSALSSQGHSQNSALSSQENPALANQGNSYSACAGHGHSNSSGQEKQAVLQASSHNAVVSCKQPDSQDTESFIMTVLALAAVQWVTCPFIVMLVVIVTDNNDDEWVDVKMAWMLRTMALVATLLCAGIKGVVFRVFTARFYRSYQTVCAGQS